MYQVTGVIGLTKMPAAMAQTKYGRTPGRVSQLKLPREPGSKKSRAGSESFVSAKPLLPDRLNCKNPRLVFPMIQARFRAEVVSAKQVSSSGPCRPPCSSLLRVISLTLPAPHAIKIPPTLPPEK